MLIPRLEQDAGIAPSDHLGHAGEIILAFDRPDANASCPQRGQSTTSPQSLLLLNSEFSLLAARRLAGAILREGKSADRQIQLAIQRTMGRVPTASELQVLQAFLARQVSSLEEEARPADELALPLPTPTSADPYEAAALTDLCLALFNLNEFLYIP